jgi:hypothetical protein
MFLYNIHWKWRLFDQAQPNGVVFHSVGFDRETADSRNLPDEFPEFILFDPNVYLWNLDYDTCGKSCIRLATFDWVPIEVPEYNSDTCTRKEWLDDEVAPECESAWPPQIPDSDDELKEIIASCFDWQDDFGVSRLIIPSNFIDDDPRSVDNFLRWIDQGLQVAVDYDTQALVSIPISDIGIDSNLENIIDNISSREEIEGIYVCIDTSRSSAIVPTDSRVIDSLLELSYHIGAKSEREVIINFGDVFGLACLAVGANAFATGYEQKSRRLNLEEFVQTDDGGGAFPRFFSLSTNTMFRSERDMERIRDFRLLRIFDNENTEASESILGALRAGQSVNILPDWTESRNNVKAARSHLTERLTRAANELLAITNLSDRAGWVMDWLQEAEANVMYLKTRFSEDPLDDIGIHVSSWRDAFERFINRYSIL